ncbi:MAG: MFS transporter [Promethearchaeota archaeon]
MSKAQDRFSLPSLILFITIVALVSSTQNMISPNLLRISEYFGFEGDTFLLGVLTFSFTILSGCSMVIFGYLADKITRKWIVFGGTALYSCTSLFIITIVEGINGYYVFFLLTCIIGIGFGAIIPSIFSLIGDLISQDDRSKGFSFFSIATLIGMAIGIGLATYLYDWRVSFFIVGIAGLISCSLILKLKEPSRIGKDHISLVDRDAVDYTYRIKRKDLKVIFNKKSNIWLVLNFIDTIPTGIILFLLFAYMEKIHNVPSTLALVFLIFILLSTLIGTLVFGIIGDNRFKQGHKKARVNLALMANIVPIPFVFIALLIPFKAPDNIGLIELFLIPGALIMLLLLIIGLFINGAVNGSWYATVVDINLPEHRGTVLATANFFDILGRAIGPLLGAFIADSYGLQAGITISIIFWALLPLFWIPVLKNVIPEMEQTEYIFEQRIAQMIK